MTKPELTTEIVEKIRNLYNIDMWGVSRIANALQVNRALVKSICLNTSVTYKDKNYMPRCNARLAEHGDTIVDLYTKGMTITDIVQYLWLSYKLATTYSGVFRLLHRVGLMNETKTS